MAAKDFLTHLGSVIASLMFIWAMFQQYIPYELRSHVEKYSKRLVTLIYPYIQITFHEFTGERFTRSEAYSAIENYLSSKSSTQAKRLKADIVRNSNQSLVLSMDDHEEVSDEFEGIKLWWSLGKNITRQSQVLSLYPASDEKRFYKLTFHKGYREKVLDSYLASVLKEGKAIKVRNRMRKLYTNNGSMWSHVVFEHPATFQTLAMEPEKKQEIIDDLITFSKAEDFYARIGRAWKRGYLLYGPPGTEHLMPKTVPGDVEVSLRSLIQGLELAKEEAKLKAEKEEKEEEEEVKSETKMQQNSVMENGDGTLGDDGSAKED
ncbi:hypothetical protein QYF36_020560 [Acer negundo]|nr:hypothetical protein QYF36_020560 [Acer negundo]